MYSGDFGSDGSDVFSIIREETNAVASSKEYLDFILEQPDRFNHLALEAQLWAYPD